MFGVRYFKRTVLWCMRQQARQERDHERRTDPVALPDLRCLGHAVAPGHHPQGRTRRVLGVAARPAQTRGLFRRLIRSEHLFTWIDPRLTDLDHPLARTTSPLEGGPNKALKDLFRTHRGMPAEHARRAAEWLLNSLTRQPRTPFDLARPEHWNPPRSRPAHTPIEPQRIGPQFGASFSWEDGNGIQHGWGGRHR